MLIEGNVFENNWADAQTGFAILFKSVNQSGAASWSETSDITFRNNIVRNSAGAINLAARPEPASAVPASRIAIIDNLFERIGESGSVGNSHVFQTLGALTDVTIANNTVIPIGTVNTFLSMDGPPMRGLTFRDNIVPRGSYGLKGGGTGEGTATLSFYAPNSVVTGNVIAGAPGSSYPTGNSFPSTLAAIQFVSLSGGNYQLSSASQYQGAGIDASALASWTANVVIP